MYRVDNHFLKSLRVGSRIFKYKKNDGSGDYILYTVLSLERGEGLVLINPFDKKEKPLKIAKQKLLSDPHWHYNPEFTEREAPI